MADLKISELATESPLTGTELVEVVTGGVNKKTTTQHIADLGGAGTSIPFGSTSGTNTYTIAATPAVTSYTNGMLILMRVGNSSTNVVTLNFDSVGAKKLLDTAGNQAMDGYLKAGVDYLVSYNSALDSAAGAFTVVNEIKHGLMNLRGVYTASGGAYPSGGGSGPSGTIRHGDTFVVSGTDTIGSLTINTGDLLTTTVDNPGQTASNWYWYPGPSSLAALVSDTAYDATSWNGVTTIAPSKNAVRDKIESINTIGVQDYWVGASAMWPRVTNGCGILAQYEMATSLFNVQGLPFDQTTQEFAQCQFVLPKKYNNGTITATPYWTAQSGSGTVQWGVSFGSYRNDDALTVALGTAQTSDDTLTATNDLDIGPDTSAITPAGTVQDANFMAMQVSRNPASDTLNADAILLGVMLHITVDAGVDA